MDTTIYSFILEIVVRKPAATGVLLRVDVLFRVEGAEVRRRGWIGCAERGPHDIRRLQDQVGTIF